MKKQFSLTHPAPCLTSYSQSQERNFDFDAVHNGIPVAWTNFGSPNYGVALD